MQTRKGEKINNTKIKYFSRLEEKHFPVTAKEKGGEEVLSVLFKNADRITYGLILRKSRHSIKLKKQHQSGAVALIFLSLFVAVKLNLLTNSIFLPQYLRNRTSYSGFLLLLCFFASRFSSLVISFRGEFLPIRRWKAMKCSESV